MVLKVLVVEDELPIRDFIGMNLTRAGYQCEYAQNGMEGANMIEKNHYDLILLDIMLPFIDGYELMQYIEPQHIPTIFISAKGTVEDRVKGLRMGADDYLVKPFSMDELLARVESVLRHMEYELLMFLIQNKNIALYRDVLYQKVWKDDRDQTRTLDLHIQRLRKKLNWHEHIKTVYKIGYMLEVPV